MAAAASGGTLPWLVDLPKGWEVVKARRVFRERKRTGFDDKPLLSVTQENGVVTREESSLRVWNPGSDISGYKLVYPKDFVISLRSFQGGLERSRITGLVSPAYTPFHSVKLDKPQVDFLRHYFKSKPFISSLQPLTSGIRQGKNISFSDFGESPLPIPPIEEAGAIASLLDRETAKIDTLIEKKRRLLHLLEEKRTALITQAVTRGLDPGVPVRDSGVEWIGQIPEHWELGRLGRLISGIDQGWSPVADDQPAEKGEIGVLKLSAIKNGQFFAEEHKRLRSTEDLDGRLLLNDGDLLVSRSNTPELVGDACIVTNSGRTLIPSDLVYRLRPKVRLINPEFLLYWFLSAPHRSQVKVDARGSSRSMVKISQGHIRNWTLLIPPVEEQQRIADYLQRALLGIREVVRRVTDAIDLLVEYRAALISAAVTGEVDVRTKFDVIPGSMPGKYPRRGDGVTKLRSG